MTDRELLELIAAQVGGLTKQVDGLTKQVDGVTEQVGGLTKDVSGLKEGQEGLKKEVRKTNIVIKNDIKPKIDALFDGYKQNSEKLEKIEEEVSKHEEIILRRVR